MNYEKYETLKNLNRLRESGAITEEEYQREKKKLLNSDLPDETLKAKPPLGLQENSYIMLMHLSQLISSIFLPLILWLIGREGNKRIDSHGKDIINFTISYIIWTVLSIIAVIFIVGIFALIALSVMITVFIIIAAVKAANGENWRYPLTIQFLK